MHCYWLFKAWALYHPCGTIPNLEGKKCTPFPIMSHSICAKCCAHSDEPNISIDLKISEVFYKEPTSVQAMSWNIHFCEDDFVFQSLWAWWVLFKCQRHWWGRANDYSIVPPMWKELGRAAAMGTRQEQRRGLHWLATVHLLICTATLHSCAEALRMSPLGSMKHFVTPKEDKCQQRWFPFYRNFNYNKMIMSSENVLFT